MPSARLWRAWRQAGSSGRDLACEARFDQMDSATAGAAWSGGSSDRRHLQPCAWTASFLSVHSGMEATGGVGVCRSRANNGGGPRVPPCIKMKTCQMLSPSIWLPWRVPEGSAGELHWAIHAWRLLDRVGFGRAHSCFTLAVWFQRERFESLLAVNIMGHVLVPWCWRRMSCKS